MLEILLRFLELFENIAISEIGRIIDDSTRNTFTKCLDNFSQFSKIELPKLKEAFYEKVGYAFLDFKGNFRKFFLKKI